ncbi:hypothetical protein PS870_06507 [Pseudomonas fluorescens]|uniref:Uncharacterized protein n=2 Tax=Pseudomonas fluorescens TaxID=294 RepID=A0A5E7QMA8_PSEFL|nr:hypothetical protein PS870_06507 [Pseudomonas fluorescens]
MQDLKSQKIIIKKFNFQWKTITPAQLGSDIETVNIGETNIICGSGNGAAIKSVNSDSDGWRFINKASDGAIISNINSAKMMADNEGTFSDGDGFFYYDGINTIKCDVLNTNLPSNHVNKVARLSYGEEDSRIWLACTDSGMYNGFPDDAVNYSVITTDDGLPSNYVRDFASNNFYSLYVTDKGLAIAPASLPLGITGKTIPVTGIDFIRNTDFLFAATEFATTVDFRENPQTCFITASANKVAVSYDNGKTWEDFTPPELGVRTITCIEIDDSALYVGTNDGLFISHKNKEIWFHYTKADGLAGNKVQDISVDVFRGKYLMVATDQGLCQGLCFNWSTVTIPDATQIYSLVNVRDGDEISKIFYAGTDIGLYKSSDDCATWTNIYNKKPVISLATTKYSNGTLFVGTDGDGIFIYQRAKGVNEKTPATYRYTTLNGLSSNRVSWIAPWAPNNFSQRVFVSYYDAPEVSYIDAYNDDWNSFSLSQNNLPLGLGSSIRVLNDKLYISTYDYENMGAYVAVSQAKLELDDGSKNIIFNIAYQEPGTEIVQDVAEVGGNVYMTSMVYYNLPDLRAADENQINNWHFVAASLPGENYMATNKGILYVNGSHSLLCYDPSTDELKAYPSMGGQQAPLIANNKIYILSSNNISCSDLSGFN